MIGLSVRSVQDKAARGMSNLYRRGRTWYARIKIRGIDYRRSLHTTSRPEARRRLDAVIEEAKQFRFQGEKRHTWKEAVVEWGKWAPDALGPSTMLRYWVSLRQIPSHLDGLYLDEITTKKIGAIVKARKPVVTNATIRRDLTAISSVLDVALSLEWTEGNPARDYSRRAIRERRDPIRLPDEADISAVVALAPGNFANLIRFAQYTGMRQEEVAGLEHSHVARGSVTLLKTKTNRPRVVALDERAGGTLRGTIPHPKSVYVFWHGFGLRYRNVASRFRVFVKRAAKLDSAFKPFRFHDLRHWFAVDYLRRGGNIYALKKILGHSSLTTTEIYLDHLTPEEQAQTKYGAKG